MSSHESAIDRVVAANSGPNYEFPPPQPALGLLILTCGVYSDTVRMLTPLTASEMILKEGLDILESAIVGN